MNTNNNIHHELKTVAPALTGLNSMEIYGVPEQYFETLAAGILNSINSGIYTEAPLPATLTVPPGYFDQLPSTIFNKIAGQTASESDELAHTPFLAGISRKNVYSLPQGYFNGFRVQDQEPVKPAKARLATLRRITRIAAAAVITGLLAIGGYQFFSDDVDSPGLTGSLQGNTADFSPTQIQQLSEQDISEFLSNTTTYGPDYQHKAGVNSQTDIDENVKFIDDSEIQQYLKENPVPGELVNSDG